MDDADPQACVEALESEGYEAITVIASTEVDTDIASTTTDAVDEPVMAEVWSLAMHINHVVRTVNDAGGDADHADAAKDALEMLERASKYGVGQ